MPAQVEEEEDPATSCCAKPRLLLLPKRQPPPLLLLLPKLPRQTRQKSHEKKRSTRPPTPQVFLALGAASPMPSPPTRAEVSLSGGVGVRLVAGPFVL